MRSSLRRLLAPAAAVAMLLAPLRPAAAAIAAYLARPEPAHRVEEVDRRREDGATIVRLLLVSQEWRGIPWRHELAVVVPPRRAHADLALVEVAAGVGGLARARRRAAATGVTVAVLGGIPNQPLLGGRWEDDLVAETFAAFVRTGDPEWPLLLPMTKATTRALDALQELDPGLRRFAVTGASKRGWTSWLAAAFDARIVGVVPVVFDNLNFPPQLRHQLASWGRYSRQIGDYTTRGLAALTDTPRGRALLEAVDPWSHRARLADPHKLVVNGSNDPYWTVDAIRHYWDGLAGRKNVLYVPNGGHGIAADARVEAATRAFVARLGAGGALPAVDVTVDAAAPRAAGPAAEGARLDGTAAADAPAGAPPAVRLTASERATAARVWSATARVRDFRDATFASVPAAPDGEGFRAALPRDAAGVFVAWFGEVDFTGPTGAFSLSTPMQVREPPP